MNKSISIKLESEMLEKIDDLAREDSRSRSNLIKLAIKKLVEDKHAGSE